MGALDSAYERNMIARRCSVLLDSLQKNDPGGYKHIVELHESRAHWILNARRLTRRGFILPRFTVV